MSNDANLMQEIPGSMKWGEPDSHSQRAYEAGLRHGKMMATPPQPAKVGRTDEVEQALATVAQTIREVRHAQSQGASWYTKGDSGLYQQVAMWLGKGEKAIAQLESASRAEPGVVETYAKLLDDAIWALARIGQMHTIDNPKDIASRCVQEGQDAYAEISAKRKELRATAPPKAQAATVPALWMDKTGEVPCPHCATLGAHNCFSDPSGAVCLATPFRMTHFETKNHPPSASSDTKDDWNEAIETVLALPKRYNGDGGPLWISDDLIKALKRPSNGGKGESE